MIRNSSRVSDEAATLSRHAGSDIRIQHPNTIDIQLRDSFPAPLPISSLHPRAVSGSKKETHLLVAGVSKRYVRTK
jgi:hypothetical protein